MAHYLDPKNDLTFKRVFGEHKHLCMSLINRWKIDMMTERSTITDALGKGEAIGEEKKAAVIAKKLLKKGLSIEDVIEATGLSLRQIEDFEKITY